MVREKNLETYLLELQLNRRGAGKWPRAHTNVARIIYDPSPAHKVVLCRRPNLLRASLISYS